MASGQAIVCFGEILLRLSPVGRELLLQSPRLDACFGGAEANVAVSLARLGHDARMASVLPDNEIGAAALGELRRHGVDVSHIRSDHGRMGVYFVTSGAVTRPGSVLYDRAGSAFAEAEPEAIDWTRVFAGADWLHVSGVTPALGRKAEQAALRAVEAAKSAGLTISFDGNYRSSLWAARGNDGADVLARMLAEANIAFVNERDLALILGRDFPGADPAETRKAAFAAAFEAFEGLDAIAATFRAQHSVGRHDLSGVIAARSGQETSRSHALDGIVDRIGAGDAFAAGVIHALRRGRAHDYAIEFGVAAAALKHSTPGDFNLVGAADIEAAMEDGIGDVRR